MTAAPVVLESTIICPLCGFSSRETMPTDACQFFYDCKGCGAVLKPKPWRLLRILQLRQRQMPDDPGRAGLLQLVNL